MFWAFAQLKGTDLFVESMIALLPRYPDWTALIAGRTTEQHYRFEKELRQKLLGLVLMIALFSLVRFWKFLCGIVVYRFMLHLLVQKVSV